MARGRAGYAADRVLLYLTAGGAFANVQTNFNGTTTTHTQSGWTGGAGIEWAFAPSWSAKLEYDYLGINGEQIGTNTGAIFTLSNPNIQQVTVGVNYLFR